MRKATLRFNNKLLGSYHNGNYFVELYQDGTKKYYCDQDQMISEFPETLDINISNRCDQNCKFCYQNCSKAGKVANLSQFTSLVDNIKPWTEIAINGNDINDQQLIEWLQYCKQRNIIVNVTINGNHLVTNLKHVKYLQENNLIYGLGVSVQTISQPILNAIKQCKNVVLHLVCGICNQKVLQTLYDQNFKVLFLGFKKCGKGDWYYERHGDVVEENINYVKDNLKQIVKHFQVVSFDNLALVQLDVRNSISEQAWEKYYLGKDGTRSMYLDFVNETFHVSSISKDMFSGKLTNDVKGMFNVVKAIDL